MNLKMDNPTNLELLRLATELVYSDYNNRRANIHNQWLADNDRMMKNYRTSVPYPTIPAYPTEEDIIDKAKKLIEFLNMPRPDLEKKELQQEVKELITVVEQKIDKAPVVEEKIDPTNNILFNEPITEKPSVIEKLKKAWR